jgi:hypothetical protein
MGTATCVVVRQSRVHIGGEPNIVVIGFVDAAQDVHESLLSAHDDSRCKPVAGTGDLETGLNCVGGLEGALVFATDGAGTTAVSALA